MEFKEGLKLALQSLWANKLRTVLTLLGVVIGVASVIAVVTLVNGANAFIQTKFSSYGADVFTVSRMPQVITSAEDYVRYQKRKNIMMDDYRYVEANCKRCLGIGAMQTTTAKVVRGTQSITDTSIRGYTWQMASMQNLNIVEGRDLTQNDEEHASHVCLIGSDIEDQLFAGVDPLGQELRVDGAPYTVVGVSEKQGSTFGQSQDNWVAIPLTEA
jgi:putative ABC transport system permease protein